jgi:hypothetical protein
MHPLDRLLQSTLVRLGQVDRVYLTHIKSLTSAVTLVNTRVFAHRHGLVVHFFVIDVRFVTCHKF